MSIHVGVRFAIEPAAQAVVDAAIADFVAHIQANESGTLLYRSLAEDEQPTRYLHVMSFADEAARERHRNSDAVRKFVDILYPRCIEEPVFTEHREVAGIQR